jgi:hypothetical protein
MAERQDIVLIFTQFQEIIKPLSHWLANIFGRPGPKHKRQCLRLTFIPLQGYKPQRID